MSKERFIFDSVAASLFAFNFAFSFRLC